MSNSPITVAFDLYGTLLSTESIAEELASHFGEEKGQTVAALWRRYQLEYTFRMNSMALYKSFSDITKVSLAHALAENELELSDTDTEDLMKAYDNLIAFPDVKVGLEDIASDSLIDAYVFSNGTNAMVESSVKQSPCLSEHAFVFKDFITVEDIEVYKPAPLVYQHLATKVGKSTSKEDMKTIWLVSGNPFDIVGARAAGLQAVWVDRTSDRYGNDGWIDRLGDLANGGPTVVVKGVDEAVRTIRNWSKEN